MNWIIDDNGRARFSDEANSWQLGSLPARPEAGLWIDRRLDPAAFVGTAIEEAPASVRLLPPPGQTFPPLAEVYIRGRDLIANLPQASGSEFGLNLCHRVVRTTPELIVCETIVTIQTDLLDSHPTLDLVCDSAGRPLENIESSGGADEDEALISAAGGTRSTIAPPAATRLDESPRPGVCVILLPPSDRAVAEDRSRHAADQAAAEQAGGSSAAPPIRYRLLAEFLEKGVIRKARYWTCRWAEEPSEAAVAELYRELLHIPLPLTP